MAVNYRVGMRTHLRIRNLASSGCRGHLVDTGVPIAIRFDYKVEFRKANLRGARLIWARANQNTTWPGGFDPKAAGVIFD